jgi:CDP-diacylglycerol--glycerol-3-phosphate 3-phosphatidyltransferase
MKAKIPYLLILLRLLFVPFILFFGWFQPHDSKIIVLSLMYIGLISDVFDGIIARQVGNQTEKMRRMDSQVDMLFWLSIGLYSYWSHPEVIQGKLPLVYGILIMEAACYFISLMKFRKETCTHAFLSKMWGLSLLVAYTFLIGFGIGGFAFTICIILGVISHVDRILIPLLLLQWVHDVPSSYHAWLIRTGKSFKTNKLFN